MRKARWLAFGAVSVLGWSAQAAPHRTLIVDDDRQQCPQAKFSSIQAAVLAASPGDNLRVCPGLYVESVAVDRTLTLQGDGPAPKDRSGNPQTEAVVQVPAPSQSGFSISASDVALSGFTILGDGATTQGVNVRPTGTGNSVTGNFVSGHVIGVALSVGGPDRRPSSITGNRIESSTFGIAIDDNLGPSPDVDNALLTIGQNTIAQVSEGLSLKNMRGVQVQQNAITDFSTGIDVLRSTQVLVSQNTLNTGGFSSAGISLSSDSADSVVGNVISGRFRGPSVAGIHLDGSTGDLVFGNQITRMQGDGVRLDSASGNNVSLNQSDTNGTDGIELQSSSGNNLFFNTLHGNAVVDAADSDRSANVWTTNRCDTDAPPGSICTP